MNLKPHLPITAPPLQHPPIPLPRPLPPVDPPTAPLLEEEGGMPTYSFGTFHQLP